MQLINLNSYNGKDIANHMSSSSGDYFDADGNAITYADLIQKKSLQQKVLNGEIATTTDPRYAKRDAQKNGDDTGPAHLKSSDYQNNFDHFVIEQIPPNLSDEQYKKYEQIITNEFRNLKVFYATKDTGFLHLGERQVLSRMDTDTTGHKHLHIVVNRMAIVDKSTVEEALKEFKENNDVKNLTDNQKLYIASLEKALSFMNLAGKDKALEQSADFQQSYLQRALTENINKNLLANGLAPIASSGSYSQNGNSNKKTTEESKKTVAEIEANNFSEESAVKAIEKINETQFSSLDSVILQRKLEENKKKAQAVSDELLRINAENRVLLEAQIAFNNATVLTQQNQELNKKVEELNQNVVEITEKFNSELQSKDAEIEVIKESFEDKLTQKEAALNTKNVEIEELRTEKNTLNEEYELLQTESQSAIEQANLKNAQLQAENDAEREKNSKLQSEVSKYDNLFETLTEQFKNQAKQLEAQQKTIDAQNELMEKMKADFEASTAKAKADFEAAIASKDEDIAIINKTMEATANKVEQLEIVNQTLTTQNESMEASNKVLTAKVDNLTSENTALMEVAVKLSEFTKKVSNTLEKFTTAVKGLVKSAPALKSQVDAVVKETTVVSKEGKQMTEAQKKIAEILKAKEEAAKAAQAGADTAPGAKEIKPK